MQPSVFKPVVEAPLPSKRVAENHRWTLSSNEKQHIASMLNVGVDAISIAGNTMNRERATCSCCGKASGLDDLVHEAQSIGVHSQGFMLDVLKNGPAAESPAHEMHCSSCGNKFEGMFMWAKVWLGDDDGDD